MFFSELIDRLPPDPVDRGRAFERLCRWYLESAPEYRLRTRKVWLWGEWPGRWGPDAGIDLVVETVDDELWAVQAKAYGANYSITRADVDSFLSESGRPQFSFRLLIATTDGIGRNASQALHGQEKPVGLLMRSHLAAADIEWPRDLRQLEAPRRPPATPHEHQQEAVSNVVQGFRDHDRGQLIMACGTGKTLVSLWVAEALGSQRTLVLMPSLTLLSQTIREWTANATQPFDYLAVCSDETVAEHDAMVSYTADLGVPVTTDSTDVARFLARPGRRVVFATYQSSPRLADAHHQGAPAFDLAIADEAHRCTGPVVGDLATVLDDARIRARKRLFMTATPRYFSGRIKKIAGEADFEIASMDEEEKFGPVLHKLTFGEAIERDLLSDYIVLVIGTDEATYRGYLASGELVTPDGKAITDARMLASHIGLAKAVRDYDLRRVVSFHGRVKRAQEFSSLFPEVVRWMPPEERPTETIWGNHVSGEMSSGKRDTLLAQLRNLAEGTRGLLSNARCLGEGVDVPAIDGVAFIDPRGSQTDIIQAVGRAIRKSPEKKAGVIVLPVFVTDADDPEQALNESPFKAVWEVLKALRAHDEVLAEELDSLRRRLGKTQGADWQRPEKVVLDLPESVGAEFARVFDVRLVTSVTSSWEFWFGLLGKYVDRVGDARVPHGFVAEDEFRLGAWVVTQRTRNAKGRLAADRRRRLEQLPGWSWDLRTDQWEEAFAELRRYVERVSDARVPTQFVTEDGFRLGLWVKTQRVAYRADTLEAGRQRRLEDLSGWSWDLRTDAWEDGFDRLKRYVQRVGDARVPHGFVAEDGFRLGPWARNQRMARAKGRLDADRERRLEQLPGWNWGRPRTAWEEAFDKLKRYVERVGDARVPKCHTVDGFRLGLWVSNQRARQAKGRLHAGRQGRLEELPGWRGDRLTDQWEEAFDKLMQFVEREGNARVPQGHVEDGLKLGSWVSERRKDNATGKLNAVRYGRLDGLPGWTWGVFKRQALGWEGAFAELRQYVDRAGDARVPRSFVAKGRFRLGAWVGTQRREYAAGRLDSGRQRRLEELLGWSWDPFREQWEEAFDKLKRYVERVGDARVPHGFAAEDGFSLGAWVNNQRTAKAKGRLDTDRQRRLEELPGWSWDRLGEQWEEAFNRLRQYVDRVGNARVPQAFVAEGRFKLGAWVGTQRRQHAAGRLDSGRQRRLEELPGWRW